MSEYIERESTVEKFEFIKQQTRSIHGRAYVDGIINVLQKIPSADVRPVVRGRWIKSHAIVGIDAKTCDVKIGETDKCSECGEEFVRPIKEYKFCPSCGADMRRGDNDGRD